MRSQIKPRDPFASRVLTVLRQRGFSGVLQQAYSSLAERYELARLAPEMRGMVPPPEMQYYSRDFLLTGRQLARIMVQEGGLAPHDRMLEVGCGIGRLALHLTSYLSPQGSYTGFDPVPFAIDWCRRRITALYPNFSFEHFDLRNPQYNPEGTLDAATFAFPYEDASFDFAACVHVLTWLPTPDHDRYLQEAFRVLRRGAGFVISANLVNQASVCWYASGHREMGLGPDLGGYRLRENGVIAYDEDAYLDKLRRSGFDVQAINYGLWSGNRRGWQKPDTLVLRRT